MGWVVGWGHGAFGVSCAEFVISNCVGLQSRFGSFWGRVTVWGVVWVCLCASIVSQGALVCPFRCAPWRALGAGVFDSEARERVLCVL